MKNEKKTAATLIQTAFIYAILAMAGGVFYREFTKFNGFGGRTTLAFVHTHLFLLGMIFFLVAALFQLQVDLTGQKRFGLFYGVYNGGVVLTVIMLIVRGIFQVRGMELSKGLDASVSGIAGIGHLLIGVGMVFFFLMLKQAVGERKV